MSIFFKYFKQNFLKTTFFSYIVSYKVIFVFSFYWQAKDPQLI